MDTLAPQKFIEMNVRYIAIHEIFNLKISQIIVAIICSIQKFYFEKCVENLEFFLSAVQFA